MASRKVIERQRLSEAVGVVIVSQSAEVARDTAAIVRKLVGDMMTLACCCGTDVAAILAAIELQPPERQAAEELSPP